MPAVRLHRFTFVPALVFLACAISGAQAGPALPATMKAVAIDGPGGVEVMTLRSVPVPPIGSNEILIAVHSAGVAIWDTRIRQSLEYISKPKFPYTLGSDGAGIVAATGSAVTRFNAGDAVYAYCWDNPKGGFYAEYVAVPANCAAAVPKGITLEEAGALGASGLTALSGVDRILGIKSGDKVIIHGASGAVGTLAVQLAKLRGASVLATASGEQGVALVRSLGADVVVDGRRGDIAAAARRFAPGGADVVLALAGGDGLARCMDALRPGGSLAWPNGVENLPKPRADITMLPYDALSGEQADQLAQLNTAVEARKFQVPIAAEFPLADAAKAHVRLEAGGVAGKIVLKVR